MVLAACLCLSAPLAAQTPVPSHAAAPDRPARPAVVATVNGQPILEPDLLLATNRLIPLASFHANVSADRLRQLRAQALQGLVDDELKFQEATRLAVRATPAEIDAGVAAVRKRYRSARAFEDALRQTRTTMATLRAVVARGILITKVAAREVLSSCGETDAGARAYYAANPARFVMPEQLHVYAITIRVDPAASAQDWQAARDRGQDLLRRIRAGESFQAVAKQHSDDPTRDKGGDMGYIHRGRLAEEFEAALRGMRPGETSEVVQTIYGFHLVHLSDVKPPDQRTFEQVRPQLLKDLSAKRCGERMTAWLADLRAKATVVIADAAAAPEDPARPKR